MFGARIHVRHSDVQAAFSQDEQERAKAIVTEICRAARFHERASRRAPMGPYLEFVSFDGTGSEQDTVSVSGAIREGRREITISVGDWARGDPLPATQKMVDELGAALERAFPDARVEVTRKDKPRILGP
jgi:hypothetical protein